MSRYRPPSPQGSKFITANGAQRLKQELDHLWRVLRPQVTQAVSEAAAQGDRSENAEYIYGKRQLRDIDRRVRFLRQRLEGMTIVTAPPHDRSKIFFGAWVQIEDEQGRPARYRIVGPDEADATNGYLSMDAPLGRALMRKAVDDEITIEAPGGQRCYVVVEVSYEE